MALASRWLLDAFAVPAAIRFDLTLFLFPLIEPDRQISRIRLSEKTHDVSCDTVLQLLRLLPGGANQFPWAGVAPADSPAPFTTHYFQTNYLPRAGGRR